MWIFDRLTMSMEGENHIYSSPLPPRDQNINLSYIKRLECEFLCCYKLMLRLHRVVVCKLTLGFT
jgi:hypothetical protein